MREPLWIYPSALARDQAVEQAFGASGAIWTERFSTWSEFIERLSSALPPKTVAQKILNPTARLAEMKALCRSWRKNRSPEESDPLSSTAALSALAQLAAEWRGVGFSVADLRMAAAAAKKRGQRHLGAILETAGEYREALEKRCGVEWLDVEGLQSQWLERLSVPAAVVPISALPPLRFVGFLRLAPFQRRVLEILTECGATLEILPAVNPTDAADAQRRFGRFAACLSLASVVAPESILRLEAPGVYAEIYAAARHIREWIFNEGVAPERIAAVCRDWGPYGHIPADVFRRLGIPFTERRGEPAAALPVVRAALSLPEAVANGCAATDIFRFLCARSVKAEALFAADAAGRSPGPQQLRQIVRRVQLERLFDEELDDPGRAWTERLRAAEAAQKSAGEERFAAKIAAARRRLTPFLKHLTALSRPQSRASFTALLRNLWRSAGLHADDRISAPMTETEAENPAETAARRARECRGLAELDAALTAASEGPGGAAEVVSPAEFFELLRGELGGRAVRAGEDGGVRLLNLYDLRGLRFARVAAVGFQEGLFPAAPIAHPLLNGAEIAEARRLLACLKPQCGAAEALPPRAPAELTVEEKLLPRLALAAAEGQLAIFRAQTDLEGRETSPSIFWRDPPFGETPTRLAGAERPAPPLAECLTPEETELRTAWLSGNRPAETTAAELAVVAESLARPAERFKRIIAAAARERSRNEWMDRHAAGTPVPTIQDAAPMLAAWCGVLAPFAPGAVEDLRRELTDARARPLSVGALENLAHCPFLFFAKHLLRSTEAEEEVGEAETPPRTGGQLTHEVLARFVEELLDEAKHAGRLTAVWEPHKRDEYRMRLERHFNAAWAKLLAEGFGGPRAFADILRRRQWHALRRRLDVELTVLEAAKPGDLAFYPACVEMNFGVADGRSNAPPLAIALAASGAGESWRLGGRCDRLDLAVEDPNAAKPKVLAVRVVDYKSSEFGLKDAAAAAAVGTLLQAQLPLYLAAALVWLRTEESAGRLTADWPSVRENSGAAFAPLRNGPPFLHAHWPVSLSHFLAEFVRLEPDAGVGEKTAQQVLMDLAGIVMTGRFAVLPAKCLAERCALHAACRYQVATGVENERT